jgi:hypothetical protein
MDSTGTLNSGALPVEIIQRSMKPLSYILSALGLLMMAPAANATIHTVHNDPLYNAEYNTIAAAITAASDFDTLLVHGSAVSYGNMSLSKPLTLIGPGHDPANGDRASFGTVQLFGGSDTTVMEGFNISSMAIYGSDCVVKACRITGYLSLQAAANETLVVGCVFLSSYLDISPSAINVEVINNYFSENSTGNQFREGSSTTLVLFNVFERSSTSTSGANAIFSSSSSFAVFANNVFLTATIASFNPQVSPNFSFQNNLTYCTEGALPSLGPNNLDNVAPTWNLASGNPAFDYGDDYNMLSGLPLTGASDGGQVGVMGGNFPLNSDGRPRDIPYVTSTQMLTPYVPENGTIDVNFQAEQGQP